MKNKKRNKQGQFMKELNSEISFVNLSTYTSPEIKEVAHKSWVEYGSDNNYFQFLIDRYNGSPTNNAAINGISQAIFGKGLNATNANKKPSEYAQFVLLFKKEMKHHTEIVFFLLCAMFDNNKHLKLNVYMYICMTI